MKTQTVDLYVDLFPGWHEDPASKRYLSACSQPSCDKPETALRVRVTVELPEHNRHIPADFSAQGKAAVES